MTTSITIILSDGVRSSNVGASLVVSLLRITVYAYQVTTIEEDIATTTDEVNSTLEVRVLEIKLSVVSVRIVCILM
jgi:hypothetical protein